MQPRGAGKARVVQQDRAAGQQGVEALSDAALRARALQRAGLASLPYSWETHERRTTLCARQGPPAAVLCRLVGPAGRRPAPGSTADRAGRERVIAVLRSNAKQQQRHTRGIVRNEERSGMAWRGGDMSVAMTLSPRFECMNE